jgi:hypothetical protein
LPSTFATVPNGPATLNGTNYINITTSTEDGYIEWHILKTDTTHELTAYTNGVGTNTFPDHGAGSSAYIPPTRNATGDEIANGLSASSSVLQGGGLKHQRVTTGSLTAGTFTNVTLTWKAAFADANYTPVCSVTDATSAAVGLSIDHIQLVTAASVIAVVKNGAAGALTDTLNCTALHD